MSLLESQKESPPTAPLDPNQIHILVAAPAESPGANLLQSLQRAVDRHPGLSAAGSRGEFVLLPAHSSVAVLLYANAHWRLELIRVLKPALREATGADARFAIHCGPVHSLGMLAQPDGKLPSPSQIAARVRELEGMAEWLVSSSRGLRTALAIADLGDPGHILASENALEFTNDLKHVTWLGLGDCPVEGGIHLRLQSMIGPEFGRPDWPSRIAKPVPASAPVPSAPSLGALRIVLMHAPRLPQDHAAADILEQRMSAAGHHVSRDRHETAGLAWAERLAAEIRRADVVIPMLSSSGLQSELLAYSVELADQVAQELGGTPRLWPLRLDYSGPLPEALAQILDAVEHVWDADSDGFKTRRLLWTEQAGPEPITTSILQQLDELSANLALQLKTPPASATAIPSAAVLEPVGGAVPLNSSLYIIRDTDGEFRAALERRDSLILLKGARQMGKTSLLARRLQERRQAGDRVIMTDLQKTPLADLDSISAFYFSLAESIAQQLQFDPPSREPWFQARNANSNFEAFLRFEVFERTSAPVVWAIDEFDRLFNTRFAGEVCGLFRSWHNERALDPASPWSRLSLAILYATEAHLFITNLDQSPFNVGTRLALADFGKPHVRELNERYGKPLRSEADLESFYGLVGGHPYLTRLSLQEIARTGRDLASIEADATREEGLFADHLRRLLLALNRDSALAGAVRGILLSKTPPPLNTFYRLRSAGVLKGASTEDVQIRCRLYEIYFRRHLV